MRENGFRLVKKKSLLIEVKGLFYGILVIGEYEVNFKF